MSIQEKIEEIRQKPEHIRMRYAWGWTAFAMVFVIFIWIFSLSIKTETKENNDQSGVEILEDLSGQKKEIEKEVRNIGEGLGEVRGQAGIMIENEQKKEALPEGNSGDLMEKEGFISQ